MTTYALVMIVKDEADKIERCLTAASRICDKAFIIDTGSSDNTIEICEAYFPGSVIQEEWVNFGVNRTSAIKRAIGQADWLFTLDADMVVEVDDDFEPDPQFDAYQIRMKMPGREWWLPLLVKGDVPWEYVGAMHEYKTVPGRRYKAMLTDQVRIQMTAHATIEKIQSRAEVLEKEMEKDQDNSRNLFYLAFTYFDLGRMDEARELFRKRSNIINLEEEETWYAAYMAAMLEPEWKDAMPLLFDAWHMRPWRPEPLYTLVQNFNAVEQFHAAYALAPSGFPPNPDICFLHSWIQDWGMKFERSVAAWHIGKIEKCKQLCEELLDNPRLPDALREKVIQNLQFCQPEGTQ